MRRVDVRIPAADGYSNGTLHVPPGAGPWPGVYPARHGFAVPDNPTFDTQASERHWAALGNLYRARLNKP